jgi:hypothetical protein
VPVISVNGSPGAGPVGAHSDAAFLRWLSPTRPSQPVTDDASLADASERGQLPLFIGWLNGWEASQFTVEADAMRCYDLWKDPNSLVTIFDLITCVVLLRLMPFATFGVATVAARGELSAGERTVDAGTIRS